MNLSQFIKEKEKEVQRFKKFWTEEMKKRPEMFPAEMDCGSWHDQYTAWEEIGSLSGD